MDLLLNNKTALITGSTAGIGFAIAESLGREGSNVIITGRKQESINKAVEQIKKCAKSNVTGFCGDLSNPDVVDTLATEYPDVDILVNNLGIFEPVPFEEISDDDWLRMFNVNVLSGIRMCKKYIPHMKQNDWGRIIFISSESGVQIPAEMIHYGMTKAAQIAISRGLAESLAGTGITVNSVLPGPTRSRGVLDFVNELADKAGQSFEEFEEAFFTDVRPTSLIKRFATPEEVASLVTYVSSPLSSATTGAALRVDGGVIKSAY
ncbi:MAG: SDR family oxidoreductase [Gammaproteobacteria bacterium]